MRKPPGTVWNGRRYVPVEDHMKKLATIYGRKPEKGEQQHDDRQPVTSEKP